MDLLAYQGRFKSFPVEADWHFHVVCRYVERNALTAALTANLVKRAEAYRWGSLSNWLIGGSPIKLAVWPEVDCPAGLHDSIRHCYSFFTGIQHAEKRSHFQVMQKELDCLDAAFVYLLLTAISSVKHRSRSI